MLSLVLITCMAAILIGRTVSTSIIEEQVSTNLETTAQSRANHIGTVLGAYNHETGTRGLRLIKIPTEDSVGRDNL